MLVGLKETFRGNEVIDDLQGIQRIVEPLESLEQKVSHIKRALPLVPLADFALKTVEINSQRAFSDSDDRLPSDHNCIEDAQFFGRTGPMGQMLRYLFDEDTPLDQLGVIFYTPQFVDYDPVKELGYVPARIKVPVLDILSCISVETA